MSDMSVTFLFHGFIFEVLVIICHKSHSYAVHLANHIHLYVHANLKISVCIRLMSDCQWVSRTAYLKCINSLLYNNPVVHDKKSNDIELDLANNEEKIQIYSKKFDSLSSLKKFVNRLVFKEKAKADKQT